MYVKFQLSTCNSFRDMMGFQIYHVGLLIFAPPWNVGANWEIWHSSLFTAGTATIGGITYWWRCTRRGPLDRRIYKKFYTLPFGEPIAPTVLGVGGPTHPNLVWWLFLFSDKAPQFKNTAVRRWLWSKFGPKFGTFCPLYKRGNMGRMSVDILWVQPGTPLLV